MGAKVDEPDALELLQGDHNGFAPVLREPPDHDGEGRGKGAHERPPWSKARPAISLARSSGTPSRAASQCACRARRGEVRSETSAAKQTNSGARPRSPQPRRASSFWRRMASRSLLQESFGRIPRDEAP